MQAEGIDGHRHSVGDEPPEFDGHVVLDDALLDLDRALHRVDSACELDQGTIAGELDYPTAVLGDPELDQCLVHSLEPGVRAGPVLELLGRVPEGSTARFIQDGTLPGEAQGGATVYRMAS